MIKYIPYIHILFFITIWNTNSKAQAFLSDREIHRVLFGGAVADRSGNDLLDTKFSHLDEEVLFYMDSVLSLDSEVAKEIEASPCSLLLLAEYDVPGIFASRYPGVFVNYAKELLSFGENKFDTKLCISFLPYPGVKAHEIGERTYFYRCFYELKETPDTTFTLDCFQTDYLKDLVLDSCVSKNISSFHDQSNVAAYLRHNTYKKEQICIVSVKDLNPESIENIFLFILGIRQLRFYNGDKDLDVYLFLDTKQSTNYKFSVYLLD